MIAKVVFVVLLAFIVTVSAVPHKRAGVPKAKTVHQVAPKQDG